MFLCARVFLSKAEDYFHPTVSSALSLFFRNPLSSSMYPLCFLHIYLHPISSLHSGPFLFTLSEFPFFSSFYPRVPHASTAVIETYTPLIYITSNSLPFPGDSYISYRRLYFFPSCTPLQYTIYFSLPLGKL